MRIFILILLHLLWLSISYGAECVNMSLQTGQTNIDFTNNLIVNPVLTVKANTNPGGCNFFITFDYGSSSSYLNRSMKANGDSWPFQVSKNSTGTMILRNFPDVAGNNDVLNGVLAARNNDQQVTVSYWAILDPSNPWLRFGNYSEVLTARLYRGDLSNYSFVDSKSITFNYNAPKKVDISVVPSGGTFNINATTEILNFGTLSSGITRTCDVILKYNAGYILKASSLNEGRLKHQTLNQYIPYAISFRGINVNLNGSSNAPIQVLRELGRSPASGLVIPVAATIGSFGGAQTGIYKDTITLTVQSAE